MKLKKFKTLDYESFTNEVKKCLSPATKKICNYYINSNKNAISNMLKTYFNNYGNENPEIIETNARFKKYMDKYYIYKKHFKEKEKHKVNSKSQNVIDKLIIKYIQKGYKIPNLEKNIFHVNPLNDNGKTIEIYFNEYIRNNKKFVNHNEKNFYYLNKLKDYIKAQKFKHNDNLKTLLDLSKENTPRNNIKKNMSDSNVFIKNYFNNIFLKKQNIENKENELNNSPINNNIENFEENKDFLKLNEYEQKNINQLIKDYEELKNYKAFVENALKDKKYFETIDNDNIDLDKNKINSPKINKEIKPLNLIYDNTKKNHILNNDDNSDDSSYNLENKDYNENININTLKKNDSKSNVRAFKNINKHLTSKFNSNFKLFDFKGNSRNYMGLSQKNISKKNILKTFNNFTSYNTSQKLKLKKLSSYGMNKDIYSDIIKNIKRPDAHQKTQNFKNSYIFQKFKNKQINFNDSKEEHLNYLFNSIKTGKNPDEKSLNEFKNYFSKKKNMSEADLNEFINRDYEAKDFYNLVSAVDSKIKSGDMTNKWRKNYLKIGRLEEIKDILNEGEKQDTYISQLLKNFVLFSQLGKIKLYKYK